MKCANCGKEIRESDAFCPYCGEPLTGFSTQHRDGKNDGITFIGSYDDPEGPFIQDDNRTFLDAGNARVNDPRMDFDDKTYLDSGYKNTGYGSPDEGRTFFDSSGLRNRGNEMTGDFTNHDSFVGRNETQEGSPYSTPNTYGGGRAPNQMNGAAYGAGYTQRTGASVNYGHGYTSSVPPYRSEPVSEKHNGSAIKNILIIIVALLILIAIGTAFYILRNRTPHLDAMTYDELVTEYDLARDDGDSIKTAYNDGSRIEFEDVSKGNLGYKATAVIYTPDMEKIYSRTTDQNGIIDRLERTTDDDLHRTMKIVIVDGNDRELTKNSAEELREIIDHQFVTIDEYNAEKQAQAAPSTDSGNSSSNSNSGSTSSDSGGTTSNTYNNYTYNVETPSDSSESNNSTPAPSSSNSGYVIPDSSSRYISSSELNGLSKWQCCVARNEIYARHGRMFERKDLQSYFNGCSWYTPTTPAASFNEGVLNSYEKKNVQTIKAYEQAHGYL